MCAPVLTPLTSHLTLITCRTKLDRLDTKDYREREERAEQLARQIEANSDRRGLEDVGTEEEL